MAEKVTGWEWIDEPIPGWWVCPECGAQVVGHDREGPVDCDCLDHEGFPVELEFFTDEPDPQFDWSPDRDLPAGDGNG